MTDVEIQTNQQLYKPEMLSSPGVSETSSSVSQINRKFCDFFLITLILTFGILHPQAVHERLGERRGLV
ncbi:hypothetical protein KOW79_020914 [Hemibagrus wyckioides]|uniref:Uncharacterized protein n=1 Tax=Hemibagrus wyckioides TaxID=337641 RepID=A0A9D3N765_9TELE|nr:hypothetical protein KOW79_020914 [Hemibagrus wyckioides]